MALVLKGGESFDGGSVGTYPGNDSGKASTAHYGLEIHHLIWLNW